MRYFVFALMILLTGCGGAPIKNPETHALTPDGNETWSLSDEERAWMTRYSQLTAYPRIEFEARAGVRQGFHYYPGNLHGVYKDGIFLDVMGPLSTGKARIMSQDEANLHAVMLADGYYTMESYDQLVSDVLQAPIPLRELQFWLRGMPTALSMHEVKFNKKGEISQFIENGHMVEYSGYQYNSRFGTTLPQKITITVDDLVVKLAVKSVTPLTE